MSEVTMTNEILLKRIDELQEKITRLTKERDDAQNALYPDARALEVLNEQRKEIERLRKVMNESSKFTTELESKQNAEVERLRKELTDSDTELDQSEAARENLGKEIERLKAELAKACLQLEPFIAAFNELKPIQQGSENYIRVSLNACRAAAKLHSRLVAASLSSATPDLPPRQELTTEQHAKVDEAWKEAVQYCDCQPGPAFGPWGACVTCGLFPRSTIEPRCDYCAPHDNADCPEMAKAVEEASVRQPARGLKQTPVFERYVIDADGSMRVEHPPFTEQPVSEPPKAQAEEPCCEDRQEFGPGHHTEWCRKNPKCVIKRQADLVLIVVFFAASMGLACLVKWLKIPEQAVFFTAVACVLFGVTFYFVWTLVEMDARRERERRERGGRPVDELMIDGSRPVAGRPVPVDLVIDVPVDRSTR